MAIASATNDPRFAPVTSSELEDIRIEISALTRMHPIAPEDVVIGRHGLMIRHGPNAGILLPQVPEPYEWTRAEFLDALCRKAGLPPGSWNESAAELYGFEAEVWGEAENETDGPTS
jgi:AmmeMemoRadiSam system protein A